MLALISLYQSCPSCHKTFGAFVEIPKHKGFWKISGHGPLAPHYQTSFLDLAVWCIYAIGGQKFYLRVSTALLHIQMLITIASEASQPIYISLCKRLDCEHLAWTQWKQFVKLQHIAIDVLENTHTFWTALFA